MKTNFTQIYNKTRTAALKLLDNNRDKVIEYKTDMPKIHNTDEVINDIYKNTSHTPIIKWIHKHAEFSN